MAGRFWSVLVGCWSVLVGLAVGVGRFGLQTVANMLRFTVLPLRLTPAPHGHIGLGLALLVEAHATLGSSMVILIWGGARNPLQTSSPPLSPGKRCGATVQSALLYGIGWYGTDPVRQCGVPETLK